MSFVIYFSSFFLGGGGGGVVVIETLITIKPFVCRMECLSTKAHMK